MAFPILSRNPLNVMVTPIDEAIKSSTEGGYSLRRPRNTRKRSKFTVAYDTLPKVDRDAIKAHYDSVGTTTHFSWVDEDGITREVYYATPPIDKLYCTGWYTFNDIELEEV